MFSACNIVALQESMVRKVEKLKKYMKSKGKCVVCELHLNEASMR